MTSSSLSRSINTMSAVTPVLPGAVHFLTWPQNFIHSDSEIGVIRCLYIPSFTPFFLLSRITMGLNFIGIFASTISSSSSNSDLTLAILILSLLPSIESSPISRPENHDWRSLPIQSLNLSISNFATSFGTVIARRSRPFPIASDP